MNKKQKIAKRKQKKRRLKLKAIDFVNIFLQYVNQVIPSLSAEVQTMFQTIVKIRKYGPIAYRQQD